MSSKLRNKVVFYKDQTGKNPIKDFLDSLTEVQRAKIIKVFKLYQDFGLTILIPHTKHLTGTPLWEIKIRGTDSFRIIYVAYTKYSILVLHGFIKKKQKAPSKELKLALKRLKIWSAIHRP